MPEDIVWAAQDLQEIKDLNDGQGLRVFDNKSTPIPQLQNDGFKVRENWPRPILNYLFNVTFRWILHLKERYSVGDIHITKSAENATAISARLGGTWVSHGTDTIASQTVTVFEKTA